MLTALTVSPMYPKNHIRELIPCVQSAPELISKVKTALWRGNRGPHEPSVNTGASKPQVWNHLNKDVLACHNRLQLL